MKHKKGSDANKVAKKLKEAIVDEDGDLVALFFDIEYLNKIKEPCEKLVSENISQVLGHDIWMEAFSYLFQVPLCENKNKAFELYNQASAPLIRDFKSLVSNLGVPCVKSIARTLHYYATNVDYNESVNQMQKLLRVAQSTRSSLYGGSSLLAVINELMAVYFQKNNLKQATNLLRTVGSDIALENYPYSERCTYIFYRGRINSINVNLKDAYEDLKTAYSMCPINERQNRRLILVYLIPVQFFYGCLPTTKNGTIEKYELEFFSSFANAIALGEIKKFDEAFQKNQLVLIKLGLYQLMATARRLVYYQLLKIVQKLFEADKVPVSAFCRALSLSAEYTIEEAEAIVSSLIKMKLIKAYVHHGLHFIVFGKDPFMPLAIHE